MDVREGMPLSSGTHPYYIHRGSLAGVRVGGSGSGSQSGGIHDQPGFVLSNPTLPSQPNARHGSSGLAFSIEPSSANYAHGVNVVAPSGVPMSEPVKKKRGRPRKYAPDGQVSLGLSPLPPKPKLAQDPSSPKRARGRPPGTGRKQRLAALGDWVSSSAGIAFAPHVIHIGVGEDIVAKILSFSQQRPRAVCILSGTGTVSSVTLRHPASSAPAATFEGRFEILCLSGSFLVAEDGGARNRTGGISAALSGPNGQVVGGAMGMLIAAAPVQVVVCSFVYGGSKQKQVENPKSDKESASEPGETASAPPKSPVVTNAFASQTYFPPPVSIWPGSRPVDTRNPHTDIDLTRG